RWASVRPSAPRTSRRARCAAHGQRPRERRRRGRRGRSTVNIPETPRERRADDTAPEEGAPGRSVSEGTVPVPSADAEDTAEGPAAAEAGRDASEAHRVTAVYARRRGAPTLVTWILLSLAVPAIGALVIAPLLGVTGLTTLLTVTLAVVLAIGFPLARLRIPVDACIPRARPRGCAAPRPGPPPAPGPPAGRARTYRGALWHPGPVARGEGSLSHYLLPGEKGPQDACGVFGVFAPGEEVSKLTYFGLYALQHRGQESAGIAASNGSQIMVYKDMGLVSQVFDEASLETLQGHIAIGHTRYATTGGSEWCNAQPTLGPRPDGTVALAHNGNLVNSDELMALVEERQGASPRTGEIARGNTTDTALVSALLNTEGSLEE